MELLKKISIKSFMGAIITAAGLFWGITEYFSGTQDDFLEKFGEYTLGRFEGAFIALVAVFTALFISSKIVELMEKDTIPDTTIPPEVKTPDVGSEDEEEDIYSLQIKRIKNDIDTLMIERSKYLKREVGSDRSINLYNNRIEKLREELKEVEAEKKRQQENDETK